MTSDNDLLWAVPGLRDSRVSRRTLECLSTFPRGCVLLFPQIGSVLFFASAASAFVS